MDSNPAYIPPPTGHTSDKLRRHLHVGPDLFARILATKIPTINTPQSQEAAVGILVLLS